MKKLTTMHVNEIKQRIGVLATIKASLEFTGRRLDDEDANKLEALQAEMARRAV